MCAFWSVQVLLFMWLQLNCTFFFCAREKCVESARPPSVFCPCQFGTPFCFYPCYGGDCFRRLLLLLFKFAKCFLISCVWQRQLHCSKPCLSNSVSIRINL